MSDIAGIWIGHNDSGHNDSGSGDSGYYEELYLSGTGTGRHEYCHAKSTIVTEFSWKVSAPNRIDFTFHERREVDEDGVTFGWNDRPASHTYELDGEVLRFDPGYHGTREFRRGVRVPLPPG